LQYTYSVECVNNQINGAVTIETNFIGIATFLAIASDGLVQFLGSNSPNTNEKVNTTTTTPQLLVVAAYGFNIANQQQCLSYLSHR
jgi:hypothetical protein